PLAAEGARGNAALGSVLAPQLDRRFRASFLDGDVARYVSPLDRPFHRLPRFVLASATPARVLLARLSAAVPVAPRLRSAGASGQRWVDESGQPVPLRPSAE